MPSVIRTIEIHDWVDFRKAVSSNEFKSWAFRGQARSSWHLFSSLSRYLKEFGVHRDAWSSQEERSLRVFKRKAHLFLDHVPDDDDDFQWLAMMQHYGTPTRLLDFTWSPFVAAFFALHRATEESSVWAVFPPLIDHSMIQVIRAGKVINARERWLRTKGNFGKYFLPGTEPFAITGEPQIMNQRLIAQLGTFVVPGKLDEPVDGILGDYPRSDEVMVKFEFDTKSIRQSAMKDLYNSNISEATLFPGIDGMAKSLAFELEYHWAYDPHTMVRIPGFEKPPYDLPKGVI